MKTIKLTVAPSTLGVGNYQSPEITVAETFNEGVLCASSPEASIQEREDGTINW